ncbi:glycosyltransferase family 4 protein [Candidatus Bathyarchaeota archaeon]|nr:glycosyltransferase family 4 protein [Candidatus Bathyarchaeota archaeon]
MKILYVVPSYVGHGTYFRCLHLGRGLAKLGNDVTLICSSHRDFDLGITRTDLGRNMRIITLPRVKYHQYYTGQIARGLISCLEATGKDYDLIHAFTVSQPPAAFPAVFAAKILRKPMFVDWDDLWSGGGFGDYHPFVVRKAIEWMETTIPRMALGITVVSELLEKKIAELGIEKNKVHKIINGSNIDQVKPIDKAQCRLKLGLGQSHRIVVSMGNTYMGDSLLYLFEAFSLVIRKYPDAKLLMVGRVDLENRSEKVKTLYKEISHSVIFRTNQPLDTIPYYLGAADALVLPMDNIPLEIARYPIRVGDYLASGRPIVSDAVGEVKRIFGANKCALLSNPGDTPAFSENIIQVLASEELQKELGNRSRRAAIDCSWAKVAQQLSEVYSDVVD